MDCPARKLGNSPHCPLSEGPDMGGKCLRKREGKSCIISVGVEGRGKGRKRPRTGREPILVESVF